MTRVLYPIVGSALPTKTPGRALRESGDLYHRLPDTQDATPVAFPEQFVQGGDLSINFGGLQRGFKRYSFTSFAFAIVFARLPCLFFPTREQTHNSPTDIRRIFFPRKRWRRRRSALTKTLSAERDATFSRSAHVQAGVLFFFFLRDINFDPSPLATGTPASCFFFAASTTKLFPTRSHFRGIGGQRLRPEGQQPRPTTLCSRRCCYRSRSRANRSEIKHTYRQKRQSVFVASPTSVRLFACTPRATAARPHERKSPNRPYPATRTMLIDAAYVARLHSTSYCQNDALTLAPFNLDQ